MTDEEKAEEYVLNIPDTVGAQHSVYSEEKLEQAYIDGLVEGREEVREHETTYVNRLHFIEQENEQLKKEIENLKKTYRKQRNKRIDVLQKENAELEAEVKRLKGIIETPCTSCCITEDLEHSLDDLNYQNINQDGEIRQLKVQIENLEKDKEQIIFESDLKIKALEDHIEKLEAASASRDECIDNLEHDLKDVGGELELWQRENAELKKTNALLYEQEKEKIKLIEKMKCCGNCKKIKYKNPIIENDCTWCINLDKWEGKVAE